MHYLHWALISSISRDMHSTNETHERRTLTIGIKFELVDLKTELNVLNLTLRLENSFIPNDVYYSTCRRRGGVLKCPRMGNHTGE